MTRLLAALAIAALAAAWKLHRDAERWRRWDAGASSDQWTTRIVGRRCDEHVWTDLLPGVQQCPQCAVIRRWEPSAGTDSGDKAPGPRPAGEMGGTR